MLKDLLGPVMRTKKKQKTKSIGTVRMAGSDKWKGTAEIETIALFLLSSSGPASGLSCGMDLNP